MSRIHTPAHWNPTAQARPAAVAPGAPALIARLLGVSVLAAGLFFAVQNGAPTTDIVVEQTRVFAAAQVATPIQHQETRLTAAPRAQLVTAQVSKHPVEPRQTFSKG